MPYKSDAQRKFFHANASKLEGQGVNISEWDTASKGLKLPEHVAKKKAILKKYTGKGGIIPSSYSQASAPIDLLKAQGIPPTVPAIPNSSLNSLGKR